MKTRLLIALLVFGAMSFLPATFADDDHRGRGWPLRATLTGFQETPNTLSTTGSGRFAAKVNEAGDAFDFKLEWKGLVGTVTQAHIHFGQSGLSGGIMIWLCGTATNPGPPAPAPLPATCPTTTPGEGTVEGTIKKENVIGPAGQGIAAGEFAEALKAIRVGAAYANIHSTLYPGGEIRGQILGRGVLGSILGQAIGHEHGKD